MEKKKKEKHGVNEWMTTRYAHGLNKGSENIGQESRIWQKPVGHLDGHGHRGRLRKKSVSIHGANSESKSLPWTLGLDSHAPRGGVGAEHRSLEETGET